MSGCLQEVRMARNAKLFTPVGGKTPSLMVREALANIPPPVQWGTVIEDLMEFYPLRKLSFLIDHKETYLHAFMASKYKVPNVEDAIKIKAIHGALFTTVRHNELFKGWE